jgi:hypothetical protein
MTLSPYRIRAADTWAQARDDYLSGMTAEAVCRRHDLGLSAFRRRAARQGWRRADQAEPAGPDDLAIYDDLGLDDEVRTARRRYLQALEQGRSVEAARWRRLWLVLSADRVAAQAEAYRDFGPSEWLDQMHADNLAVEAEEEAEDVALGLPEPHAASSNVHDVHPVFSSAHFAEPHPAPDDTLRNSTRAAP